MAKKRYEFNLESLRIELPQRTLWQRIKHFVFSIGLGIVLATLFVVIANKYIATPREKSLINQIDNYKFQYRVLNDRVEQMQKVLDNIQDRDDNIYRIIFEAEPIPTSNREAGFGGLNRYEDLDKMDNDKIISNSTKKIDKLTSKLVVQSKSFDEVFKMAKDKGKMIASLPAIQPIGLRDVKRIGSYFGIRTDPFYKVKKMHEGIDFTAPVGTPVYATGDGTITTAEYNNGGYGNIVKINHGYTYVTIYAHLSKIKVKNGQKVKRGEVIGTVGNTGKSTAPHLHYEVRKGGKSVNPIYFFYNDITPEEFKQMIELSALPSQTLD